jgi:hypothetical protein
MSATTEERNMEATGIHPANLRSTTDAQIRAIEVSERNIDRNDNGVTLVATVAGWDGYDGSDLAVQFIYSYDDGRGTDLEVTVFDADGNVVDSQDFG